MKMECTRGKNFLILHHLWDEILNIDENIDVN